MDDVFLRCLEEAVGTENARVFVCALDEPPSVSLRLNPFKKARLDDVCADGSGGLSDGAVKVPWSPYGFLLDHRPDFTLDPLLHGGAYYVQDSSAMFVGEVVRNVLAEFEGRQDFVRVLDLCAAPGGKTTDLAASLRERFGDNFLLVANEVNGERAAALVANVTEWGDPCVIVTSDVPSSFAALKGFFDIIVADVPCSGEGMFRKDEEARRQWSEANVAMCAERQKRIVADVWPALSGGGAFVYSTCTYNIYENDGNVGWMVENLDCEPLIVDFEDVCGKELDFGRGGEDDGRGWKVLRTKYGFCLLPGLTSGEGQFCAALRNVGEVHSSQTKKKLIDRRLPEGVRQCETYFTVPMDLRLDDRKGTVTAVPQTVAHEVDVVKNALHTHIAGTVVGTLKGSGIVPSSDMALSIKAADGVFNEVELDLPTALAFLHRDTIVLPDAPKGYLRVLYKGIPLGFVKNIGVRCNNLHPYNRRIRMNIKQSI